MKELKRILHVDDEADIREIGKLALEAVGGFMVESCASGSEAVQKGPGFAPDLLLLDVMMPGMDGPATLRALREIIILKNVPAVFMTAKAQPSEIAALKDLGAVDVIVKPFDPMSLAQQLSDIWSRAMGGS